MKAVPGVEGWEGAELDEREREKESAGGKDAHIALSAVTEVWLAPSLSHLVSECGGSASEEQA